MKVMLALAIISATLWALATVNAILSGNAFLSVSLFLLAFAFYGAVACKAVQDAL